MTELIGDLVFFILVSILFFYIYALMFFLM